MKCHYEVLCVLRDSDDAAIKTAYRKLALRWHPDKNPDNLDAAKEQFLLIQQAYDVLSDPQERAWYDNHREQILRGSHTDYEDSSLDVYQYFTATCYRGFGDDPAGFYAVYRQIFERLATEDIEFMDTEEDFKSIPNFGKSTSDYDDVVGPFYAYWMSYCTKKTYAWLCPHNVSEIRDRRILREIEKETKKIGAKARKERNEEVRALVAFVRKRDKRVLERKRQLEEKAEQNRIKQKEKRLEQIRRNKKEIEEMSKLPKGELYSTESKHEEQLKMMEEAYASSSDEDSTLNGVTNGAADISLDDVTPADLVDSLYCIACNKAFKNESSFKNHETSKRHKDNIEKLKSQMRDEDELYDSGSSDEADEENGLLASDVEDVDEVKDEEIINSNKVSGEEETDGDEKDEEPFEIVSKSRKKSNKNKSKKPIVEESPPDDIPDFLEIQKTGNGDDDDDADDWNDFGKKSKKSAKSKKSKTGKVKLKTTDDMQANTSDYPTSVKSQIDTSQSMPQIDLNLTCAVCKSHFTSKNKLFSHLKSTKHGIYIDKTNPAASVAAVTAPSTKKIKKKQFYSKVTL